MRATTHILVGMCRGKVKNGELWSELEHEDTGLQSELNREIAGLRSKLECEKGGSPELTL